MKAFINFFINKSKKIYRKIPIKQEHKIRLKALYFKAFKPLIKNRAEYKIWRMANIKLDKNYINDYEAFHQEVRILGNNHKQLFESKDLYSSSNIDTCVELVAFYLPQYHPIKENDEWWGEGFTEWTNVTKALPQFTGHYQPRRPYSLGYYDLRVVDNMKKQASLAKEFGIHAFCFYHYWFSSKRVLELPVDNFLRHKEIDIKFCLCWANENWTRTWDGGENDILLEQKYLEDDPVKFIMDLEPYLVDDRYMRIDEKPFILVYKADDIPEPKKTIDIWRDYCKSVGIGEILVYCVDWDVNNHIQKGFDGIVEFPPHSMHFRGLKDINKQLTFFNDSYKGIVYDYSEYVDAKRYIFPVDYNLIKSVSPSWDNTARRMNTGTIFHNSSPKTYKKWLINVLNDTVDRKKKHVFINAWNEWAEGAYLEPDEKYGYAYLNATRQALIESKANLSRNDNKLIFVSHDAHFHGAQLLSLHIIKVLKQVFNIQVFTILRGGGVLVNQFKEISEALHVLDDSDDIDSIVKDLDNFQARLAICNSAFTGGIVKALSDRGIKCISLIHELPRIIEENNITAKLKMIDEAAEKIVFPSNYVLNCDMQLVALNPEKTEVLPQGLYNLSAIASNFNRNTILKELGINQKQNIVIGVGFADYRKGLDLFIEVCAKTIRLNKMVHFIWLGNIHQDFMELALDAKSHMRDNITFISQKTDVRKYYEISDVHILTSREDPFPSTVLEAMNYGLPVIGFENAGGFSDIINDSTGKLVAFEDTTAMAEGVIELLNPEQKNIFEVSTKDLIQRKFNFVFYVNGLLKYHGKDYKKISVIIPNYNYDQYLKIRIESVLNQTYPISEIIILDDSSNDNSREIIEKFHRMYPLRIKTVFNENNSGNVFAQWKKGFEIAQGDYVWIAEADDYCVPNLINKLVALMEDSDMTLAYAQSFQVDQDGNIVGNDYLDYVKDIDEHKWKSDFISKGIEEIRTAFAIKNVIPNISAALIKNDDYTKILEECSQYKVAGDWYFYLKILEKGNVGFISESLNFHRRHQSSVTISKENNKRHFDEICKIQDLIQNNYSLSEHVKEKMKLYRAKAKQYLKV